MDIKELVQEIEIWDKNRIRNVLNDIKGSPIEVAIKERYQEILDFVKGKRLSDLINLPEMIMEPKIAKKTRWKPSNISQEIIATLPIKKIDLGGKLTKKLPIWITYLNPLTIEDIDIGFNQKLLEIPPFISRCKNLKKLNLYGTAITMLPKEFKQLTKLECFNFPGLLLAQEGWDFKGFDELRSLQIDSDEIEPTPALWKGLEQLSVLKNLSELLFSYYPYTTIPKAWSKLSQLSNLGLKGPIGTTFFSIKYESKYYNGTPDLKSEFLSKEAIAHFLKTAAIPKEDYTDTDLVFDYLESENKAQIQKGLKILEDNEELKQCAEARYLPIIRVLLKNPNATIEQLVDLTNCTKIFDLIYKVTKFNNIDFSNLDKHQCRLVVDFLGALIQNVVKIEDVQAEIKELSTEEALKKWSSNKGKLIRASIEQEFYQGLLSKGWLQKILEIFCHSRIYTISGFLLDHTNFSLANDSLVLEEFYLFLSAYASSNLHLDIAQSDAPNLTAIFWTFSSIPSSNWQDTAPNFPPSPLSFERSFKFKGGDDKPWKTKNE